MIFFQASACGKSQVFPSQQRLDKHLFLWLERKVKPKENWLVLSVSLFFNPFWKRLPQLIDIFGKSLNHQLEKQGSIAKDKTLQSGV